MGAVGKTLEESAASVETRHTGKCTITDERRMGASPNDKRKRNHDI